MLRVIDAAIVRLLKGTQCMSWKSNTFSRELEVEVRSRRIYGSLVGCATTQKVQRRTGMIQLQNGASDYSIQERRSGGVIFAGALMEYE
jgi:hypothetical protein